MKINKFWRKSSITQKIIFCIYILSFLIASFNHLRDVVSDGLFPYTNYPQWGNLYWTLLTFFDPLAIIILFLSLKIGRILYAVIIISDVVINLYFTILRLGFSGIVNIFMLGQMFFLIFLIVTWKLLKQENVGKENT